MCIEIGKKNIHILLPFDTVRTQYGRVTLEALFIPGAHHLQRA